MRSLVLVAALAAPVAASAQSLNVQVQQQERVSIGPDNCSSLLPSDYTLSLAAVPCSDLKIWLTSGDCGDAPASGELVVRTVPQAEVLSNATGNFVVNVADLPIFDTANGGQPCGSTQTEETFKVCGVLKYQNQVSLECSMFVREGTPPTVHFDSKPPEVPTITKVDPLDSALSVGVSVDDDTRLVTVQARVAGTTDVVKSVEKATPTNVVRVEGLANGTEYEVVAQAKDEAGNVSALSAPSSGTPVAIAGFGRIYKDMGGQEEGGCSAVGATTAGLWTLVLATWFISRRRSWR